jgi:hypothetical protein
MWQEVAAATRQPSSLQEEGNEDQEMKPVLTCDWHRPDCELEAEAMAMALSACICDMCDARRATEQSATRQKQQNTISIRHST